MIKNINNNNEEFLIKKSALSLAEKDSELFDLLENDNTIINHNQDDLDKKIYSMFDEHFNKIDANLIKQINHKKSLMKIAVAIVLTLSSSFIIPFITVDAFREKVLTFYIETFDTHASFTPEEENKNIPTFKVGYIPEGYNESDKYNTDTYYSLTFYSFENKIIDIALYNQKASFSVDTENCEKFNIIINYSNGYIYRKPGTVIMIFKFHGNSIVISSNDDTLSNDELISIGKSIK